MAATFPGTPVTSGLRYPQDYSITNLTLLTPTNTWDVKNAMVELSYHEDLFNNTASGYLMLTESTNYVELMQLNGNEFLRMTFSTTGQPGTEIDKLFRVYKMGPRRQENNMYTMSYALYFCSEEMMLNEQYKVCKSYPNQEIYKNIVDILQNEMLVDSSKINYIEKTYGSYDFVIPTLKPFDAINFMSVYARTASGGVGSDMIFYEDKYGFNFRSLQSLMTNPIYHKYTYNPKNTDPSNLNSDQFNILTYEILNSYDTLAGVNSGIFANQLISADILTRTKTITNFDYGSYQKNPSSVQLNPFTITNQYTNRKGDQLNQSKQAVLKLIFSNYDETSSPYIAEASSATAGNSTVVDTNHGAVAHNIYAETYVPYRTAQLALANYTRIKVSVPGDSNLTVGATVNFALTSTNPLSHTPDAFYSGNYLVTAVRHLINDRYITILELCKDSVPTPYSSPDSTSTIWQNSAKGIFK